MQLIVSKNQFVVGVDTHAQKHMAAVVDNYGAVIATREIRVTGPQMSDLPGFGKSPITPRVRS